MQLAVVNYAADDAPARFARSMHETGFGILVDHPITDGLIDSICDEWLGFFLTETKHGYHHAAGEQAGYFPPPDDREAATGALVRDRKEFFHVCPRARYPHEVSDGALRYFDEAIALSEVLLAWLAANAPAEVVARFFRCRCRGRSTRRPGPCCACSTTWRRRQSRPRAWCEPSLTPTST